MWFANFRFQAAGFFIWTLDWHFLLLFNPWISHHKLQRSVEYEVSSKKGQVTFSEGSTVLEVPTFFKPSSSLQRSHREESYGVVAFSYGQTGASVQVSDTATLLRVHQREQAVKLFGSEVYGQEE